MPVATCWAAAINNFCAQPAPSDSRLDQLPITQPGLPADLMCCINIRRSLWRVLQKLAALVSVHVCCVSEEALEEGPLFCRQALRALAGM